MTESFYNQPVGTFMFAIFGDQPYMFVRRKDEWRDHSPAGRAWGWSDEQMEVSWAGYPITFY